MLSILENILNTHKFVIQYHVADRAGAHYDIRIEKDGVFKSWATKKLKTLIFDQSKKISIFQQPDHDLSWADFTGKIADGYGAGEVSKYDFGNCDVVKWTDDKIIVSFHGQKLIGTYILLKYPGKDNNDTQWLFFKSKNL